MHKNGENALNLIILGVALTDSSNVLVLKKGSIQVIKTSTIQADSEPLTNCTTPNKKIILSVHYNGNDSYLFTNNIQ